MISKAAVLVACMGLSLAQTPASQPALASNAPQASAIGGLPAGGPLQEIPNPAARGPTGSFGQLLSNPLMSLGLTGGDNLMRAAMSPYMSQFGPNANYYFLRGGMDAMAPVMMSDMMGRALAQSTGMNPLMTSMITGQMFDAPDTYALNNMLFGMGRGQGPTNPAMGSQPIPNGAASPNNGATSAGFGAMNPFALATTFALM